MQKKFSQFLRTILTYVKMEPYLFFIKLFLILNLLFFYYINSNNSMLLEETNQLVAFLQQLNEEMSVIINDI